VNEVTTPPLSAMDAGAGLPVRWGASLACAGVVLLATSAPTYLKGAPSLLAPAPVPWIALYLLLLGPLALAIPPTWFLAWTPQLRAGTGAIPRRSIVLLAVLAVLSVGWGVAAWSYGIRWQGMGYTRAVLALTAGWIVLLAGVCAWARRRPSFARSCLFHTLLFTWLGWYAFPWLGELP
jgi:hypothetical protein